MVVTTDVRDYTELKELYCTTARKMRDSFRQNNVEQTHEYGNLLMVLPTCFVPVTQEQEQ